MLVNFTFRVYWWYIPVILVGWYLNSFVSAFVREIVRDLRETKKLKRR